MRLLIFILCFYCYQPLFAQSTALGQWTDHSSANFIAELSAGNNKIFGAAKQAISIYNLSDNSISKLNRTNSLSDIDISTIAFHDSLTTLIVGYSNGNIDLINDNGSFTLPDIKRANIIGDKSIYKIVIENSRAWLACGFGIVVIDLVKKEVIDNYRFGPNGSNIKVNDLCFLNGKVYAATQQGVYLANLNNPFLANFQNWSLVNLPNNSTGNFNAAEVFDNKVFVNFSTGQDNGNQLYYSIGDGNWQLMNTGNFGYKNIKTSSDKLILTSFYEVDVYDTQLQLVQRVFASPSPTNILFPQDGIFTANSYWLADLNFGLLLYNDPNKVPQQLIPNGPKTANAFKSASLGGYTYIASGGVTPNYSNLFRPDGIFSYKNQDWNTLNKQSDSSFNNLADFMSISIDPKDPQHLFVGTWSSSSGISELQNGKVIAKYNDQNSTLEQTVGFAGTYRVGASALDLNQNLWVGNSYTFNNLHVKKNTGEWIAFDISEALSSPTTTVITQLVAGADGTKWLSIFKDGLVAFNDNNTPDDKSDDLLKKLSTTEGAGALPSMDVFCVIEDLDGEIWIGTNTGFAILYNPSSVFTSTSVNLDQPIIFQNGNFEKILANEQINHIAIDGANRKWMATQTSGVYLLSADGTEQVLHFTAENSPLLSNEVYSVCVDELSGEVFFSTSKGIQSYKSDATAGSLNMNELSVFPNPVRPDYEGEIAIKGFVANADVKITDIAGNVVFQTKSKGGTATWNGLNFRGEKPATGIYLVFASNFDGSETTVGKIMFIK